MKERSDEENPNTDLREKIIGVGGKSHRKSYYPQLKQRIEETELALEALKESEERYRGLVENVNIGIFRSLPNGGGNLVQVNPAFVRIMGFPNVEKLLQMPVVDLFHIPSEREALIKIIKEKGRLDNATVQMVRADGTIITASLSYAATYDEKGEVKWIDGVIEDITDKVIQHQALCQANSKLNLLNSITRHDIINQIIALKGFLALLEPNEKDERTADIFAKAGRTVDNIERQISFTKDYQEIGVKSPQWIKLNEAILSSLMTVDKATLDIHVDVGHYQIFADPMVTKVFHNLCMNALKHSKARNLFIATEVVEKELVINFRDDGVGIVRKEHLFERGNSRSGYGLFLSKEILAITNIDIKEIGKVGEGAHFEVTVPPWLFSSY